MKSILLIFNIMLVTTVLAQPDTIIIGLGGFDGVMVSTSDGDGASTLDESSFLPNENAASRFLSQASLGHAMADIDSVVMMGYEGWLDAQFAKPIPYSLKDKAEEYRQFVIAETNGNGTSVRYWWHAWWQYHMTNKDVLRQRVAFALSEMLVISEESSFSNNGHALSDYYDILLENSFGNYRDLLEKVSYHPAMGVYLTSLNNDKTDTIANRFPDENYAREIMQLFSIGTTMLNNDGSEILDENELPVPSYTNDDIVEFAKVFTGLTWWNRVNWGRGYLDLDSWLQPMVMWDDHHDPGEKFLLNGFVVPDRDPVDGDADIQDAIDNIFNHQNVPPFVSRFLIQRLVTANPTPGFIDRVSNVFVDNGNGVRGDMKAVVRAILLDEEAKSCENQSAEFVGSLKEPFIRYMQINRAFEVSTLSGVFRNDMRSVYDQTGQRPLAANTVFNFFQYDYQPIGPIENEGLVAPVFQITDAQSIAGYINGLYRWIYNENIADEGGIYGGEPSENYQDEISMLDFSQGIALADDENLKEYLDQLNLLLASGRLSEYSIDIIYNMITRLEAEDEEDKERRVKVAIYLVMTSPEYLINR